MSDHICSTVIAKDLYTVLRNALDDDMKDTGFKRIKSGRLGWFRPMGAAVCVVHFWVDKYGWMESFGSKFTLDFDVHDEPVTANSAKTLRFYQLLSPNELEQVREINNAILGSLPKPNPDNPVFALNPEQQEAFMTLFMPQKTPYRAGQDIWMHYYTISDVEKWATFLRPLVPRMVGDYVTALESEKPTASIGLQV